MEASYENHPVRVALTDESPSAEGSSREAPATPALATGSLDMLV